MKKTNPIYIYIYIFVPLSQFSMRLRMMVVDYILKLYLSRNHYRNQHARFASSSWDVAENKNELVGPYRSKLDTFTSISH